MLRGMVRADAERNRRQLVDAARVVLAERGLDAPLDEIAKRAGVGNATLYRRFPSRGELIATVFADTLRDVVAATVRAVAEPDPWTGFAGHLEFLCALQAEDRALGDLLYAAMPGVPTLDRLRAQAFDGLTKLIERAQAAGVLREDFGHADVVLILMANAGLVGRTSGHAPAAWRRHLSYVLDGLRAAPEPNPAAPAPDTAEVLAAMRAIAQRLECRDTT